MNALIIDDEKMNRLILRAHMERLGFEVSDAESGMEGLEMAACMAFDCVLMDERMPGLSGADTAGLMRADGYTKPIIATSCDDQRLGVFSANLRKPISRESLRLALASLGLL